MNEVQWCLTKLQAALADYDVVAAKAYAEMAELWLARTKT